MNISRTTTSKKVLFITSTFPTSETDIQVPWMVKLIEELLKEGLDISVFAPEYLNNKTHNLIIGNKTIKVTRFKYWWNAGQDLTHGSGAARKAKSKIRILAYMICGWVSLQWYLLFNKYDILHVHWPFPHIFWLWPFHRTKVLSTWYSVEEVMGRKTPLFFKIARNFGMNIAISSYTKEKCNLVNTEIIPYGPSIDYKEMKLEKNDKPIILFVGRLVPRKGAEYLIDAAKKINSAYFHIIGDGPLFEQLEKTAPKHVRFYGKVSTTDLEYQFNICDIFVAPSITDDQGEAEGLCVPPIEAMMYKKPVFGTLSGGMRDVFESGIQGEYFPEKDSEALSKLLSYWTVDNIEIKNKLTTYGARGYEKYKEKFSWDIITSKYLGVYKKIKGD